MKEVKLKGTKGEDIVFLSPETAEDYQKLEDMEKEGKLSSNNSFGDWIQPGPDLLNPRNK